MIMLNANGGNYIALLPFRHHPNWIDEAGTVTMIDYTYFAASDDGCYISNHPP